MKYGEWLNEVEPKPTPKGARLDLQIYVYPDGHGNILISTTNVPGQPVNDFDEAASVLRDLWEKASRVHEQARPKPRYALDELLDQMTPENVHGEIDSGPPVGREIW